VNKMIGTNHVLTPVDQALVEMIARARFDNNRNENIQNAKIGSQSNYETDLEGFGAEVAFCRLFGTQPDTSIHTRSSNTDTGDTILSDGRTVDVKSTKYDTGRLVAVSWKKNNVDLFCLMTGTFPSYIFKGFMKSDELLQDKRLGSLGYGNSYLAEQNELQELDQL
jgi:hypothetical protein